MGERDREDSKRNAFESRNRGQLPEVFHSEFLGVAIRTSLNGDKSLFTGILDRCALKGWVRPRDAWVETEHVLGSSQRIDILIGDEKTGHVIGIEVKTTDETVPKKQLEDYRSKLCEKYGEENIAMVFLTPFNYDRAEAAHEGAAEVMQSVEAFNEFSDDLDRVHHLSWRDLAEIDWEEGGELWKQHQEYVCGHLAADRNVTDLFARSWSFSALLGKKAAYEVIKLLASRGTRPYKGGVEVDLRQYGGKPHELAAAVRTLIEQGEGVVPTKKTGGHFPDELRRDFVDTPGVGAFHWALFRIAEQFENVWLQGISDYGLRVAHRCKTGSVSLVTSRGVYRLRIGQLRRKR